MPAFTFCSFRLGASNAPGTFRRPEARYRLSAALPARMGRAATRAREYAIRFKGGQIRGRAIAAARPRFTPAPGRPDNAGCRTSASTPGSRKGRGRGAFLEPAFQGGGHPDGSTLPLVARIAAGPGRLGVVVRQEGG